MKCDGRAVQTRLLAASVVPSCNVGSGPAICHRCRCTDITAAVQGTYNPGAIPEPNNIAGNEYCAVGNWSQKVAGVFSWSDTGCNGNYIFMCWAKGEQRLLLLRLLHMYTVPHVAVCG